MAGILSTGRFFQTEPLMFTREVWRYTFPLLLIAVVAHYFSVYYAAPFYIAAIVMLYLFRLPGADIPSCALCLVSPANGEVTAVNEEYDPYIKRNAKKITIMTHVTDAYPLRSVTEGKVVQYWEKSVDTSSRSHEKVRAVWIQTDENDDAVVVMHPARYSKVNCYVATGERVGLGQQCGCTPFGGIVEIYLPENSRVQVQIGDKVIAGKDIVAEWVHG